MNQDNTWVNLMRWANDYRNEHGGAELSIALDCKIVKTSFIIMEAAMYKKENGNIIAHNSNFSEYLCSRKFNLMSLLYSYSSLVERKKIYPFDKLSQEYYDSLSNELELWPDKWRQHYDKRKMLIIIHVAVHIAESLSDCIENKKEYTLEL